MIYALGFLSKLDGLLDYLAKKTTNQCRNCNMAAELMKSCVKVQPLNVVSRNWRRESRTA